MHPRILLLLCLLGPRWGAAQTTSAGPAATVEVSRTHCLVRFVEALAGGSGTYAGTRQAFERSRFNTPAARRWLRRYQALGPALGYRRDDYPADRLSAFFTTAPAYLAASVAAPDLADLQRRTVGLLPNETLVGLDSVYRYFEPVFDTLAWQPHAAALARQRVAYADYLAHSQLMRQFGRLRTFYGSVWPDAVPYRIQLNPQPDAGPGFTNHAWVSGDLVLLDCHPDSRDFAAGSTIVFHEMSHSLSAQQRRGVQQQLERWYLGSASPNRRAAYYLMEEALATAAGEWVYAQQTGRPETDAWYNDDYINRYAHALYPAVAAYVERGQCIDSLFVQQAIGVFDRTFPQAGTDYVNLFRKVLYWTDADDFHAATQPFQDRFNSTLSTTSTPILGSPETVALAQRGEYFPVVLVTRAHAATLRYLRQQLPALRRQRLRAAQAFVLSTTGPNGPLVLVNAHTPAQLAAAATLLAQRGHFDPAAPITLLP